MEASDFGAGCADLSWYSPLDVLLAHLICEGGIRWHIGVRA